MPILLMIINRIKISSSKIGALPFLAIIIFLASSCSITRRVPDDRYLLDKVKMNIESNEKLSVKESDLQKYVRQQPNKRILFFRFHLRIFNAAKPHKYTGFSRWLKTIGEEPVILDTFLTHQSTTNLKRYLDSKGYYSSNVFNSTEYDKKKAEVSYLVKPGLPYKIRNISYVIEDASIRRIVINDTINRILAKGAHFDIDLLKEERIRIEKLLKEEGYFFFSRDFITFNADTSISNRRVDLELFIRNRFIRDQFGERIPQTYKKYEINNVFFYPNYDPVNFFQYQQSKLLDTIRHENQFFVFHKDPGIKLKTLTNSNLIKPGNLYSESTVKTTRSKLTSLRLYRVVNVFFEEYIEKENGYFDDDNFLFFNSNTLTEERDYGQINCHIQLTPHTLQSYQVDLVGTNSASDIGIEGNLNYQHKNIFRGAETFDIKLRGMVEILSSDRTGFDNAIEYGGSIGFGFPRFLGPQYFQKVLGQYNPRTQISSSYNYQNRPQYTRTVAGLSFGYNWRGERKFSHTIIPAEINLINIFAISPSFYEIIRDTYLENSYISQLITLSSYSMIYNNQLTPRDNFSIVRLNLELSGNLLNGAYSIWGQKAEDDSYKIFNISFSQFVRSDINYSFNHILDENNTFVYRVYAGAGLPYGNSKALPFEKKYFSGGSTGIRAWNARSLGPGTYVEFKEGIIPNQTADIKLEANIEYRFKLIWMLEGALFLDAGNIWAISSADERPGALFKINEFYKQFALGTGTGLRMDLGFFVIRFDLGVKVHDPGINISTISDEISQNIHWIPFNRPYKRSDFVINFGIGYPF